MDGLRKGGTKSRVGTKRRDCENYTVYSRLKLVRAMTPSASLIRHLFHLSQDLVQPGLSNLWSCNHAIHMEDALKVQLDVTTLQM